MTSDTELRLSTKLPPNMADMTSHLAPRTTLLACNFVPAATIIINMIFCKRNIAYFHNFGDAYRPHGRWHQRTLDYSGIFPSSVFLSRRLRRCRCSDSETLAPVNSSHRSSPTLLIRTFSLHYLNHWFRLLYRKLHLVNLANLN